MGVAFLAGPLAAVTLDEADPVGSSSFTEGTRWSDGAVPSSDKSYYVFLGADKYLRSPEEHDVVQTTTTWSGGTLTLGSDSTEGWLYLPIYSGWNTLTTDSSTWYPRVKIADLHVVKGGIVAPYLMWSGINGQITFEGAEPIDIKVGGSVPSRSVGGSNWNGYYLSAKLVGETNQVVRITNTSPAGDQFAVYLTEDNSGYKGQFVFDGVAMLESAHYSGWSETGNLNANRYGGDPGYFRADALYFPHGMTLGRPTNNEPGKSSGSNVNMNRPTAVIGHPNRGITFAGGGFFGGYISCRYRCNMKITGDVLTICSGISQDNFGYSGGYVYLEKTPDVEAIKFSKNYFPRLIFGPEVTDVTHFPIQLTNNLSTAVGATGTCRMRVNMDAKAYVDIRQNEESTDMGHVIIDEASTIEKPLKVLIGGLPARGLKTTYQILTVPDTLVTEADIQLLGTGTGTAISNPYQITHADGCYTVSIGYVPGQIRYVVPAGTAGNVPTDPYTTWETAANDIQTAVNAATAGSGTTSGQQVFVAPGVYPISTTLVVEKYIHLRSCDRETGELATETTILDGGYPARTNRIMKLKNAQVSGFTFRNGATTAKDYYTDWAPGGGAIQAYHSNDWAVKNCIFRNNRSIGTPGGALTRFAYGKCLQTFNCQFEGNVAENSNGGAVGAVQSNGEMDGMGFTNCTFIGNRATGTGRGGAACNGRAMYFYNCTFKDNFAGSGDGDTLGMNHETCYNCVFEDESAGDRSNAYIYSNGARFEGCVFRNISTSGAILRSDGGGNKASSPGLINCVFTNLTAGSIVSGVNVARIIPVTQCLVQNCTLQNVFGWHTTGFYVNESTIAGNTITTEAFIYNCQNYPTAFVNSILWDNVYGSGKKTYEKVMTAALTNSIVQTLNTGGAVWNSWSQAPGFRAAATQDCHLHPGAFACDLANVTADLDLDLEGNPRRVDPRGKATAAALPDLGCFECQQPRGGGFVIFFD